MIQEQFFPVFQLCPGGQTFLSEEHLKDFANAYSISENDLKHEIPLANNLLRKESKLPWASAEIFPGGGAKSPFCLSFSGLF